MKSNASRGCPVPSWAFFLAFLCAELTVWVLLGRHGVARGWWSDLVGGLLAIGLPFVLRFLVCFCAYRVSRWKGMALDQESLIRRGQWWKFFLLEYAHFCKQSLLQLPFPLFFRTSSDRGNHAATGRVLVLQHGYSHNGAVWSSTARALERRGYRVYTLDQPLWAPIDTMADRLAARIQEVCAATRAAHVTLVAHSMGGLIARAYLRKHGAARVDHLITLGTPHHGTFHARLAHGTNGGQMRLGNPWLQALNGFAYATRTTSIYSVHDTVIAPQDSSIIEGAHNVRLIGVGHVSMPSGRVTRAALIQAIEAGPPAHA